MIFSTRKVPGVFALCDPPSLSIGLFPRARGLGPWQRRETLVHECCHLRSTGLHTRLWKGAMRRAAGHAWDAGHRRLATMIRFDIGLYDRREVSDAEVHRQLALIMNHLRDHSYPAVRRHLADWAGWPVGDFAARFPWLADAWRFHATQRQVRESA